MKARFQIRDLFAIPFITVGGFIMYIGAVIGGAWTSERLLEVLKGH